MRTTGKVVKTAGKVGWGATKVTAKVAKTTGKVAWKTGKMTNKGMRTMIYMARGKQIIPLEKQGNSLYAKIRLNRKTYAKFLVDTGASQMQISKSMAARLRIKLHKAEKIPVSLAGGHIVSARKVMLKEVRVGSVRVKNVAAIVLDQDNLDLEDGLLGMSFLNHFRFQIDTRRSELILEQRVVD